MKEYKFKWRYKNEDRPKGCCYDCRMKYSEFPDMIIPDNLWELINPTEYEGSGLLCPTCIANRLEHIGMWKTIMYHSITPKPYNYKHYSSWNHLFINNNIYKIDESGKLIYIGDIDELQKQIKKQMNKSINEKHFKDIMAGNIAINCQTENDTINLMQYFYNKGLIKADDINADWWKDYKENTCCRYLKKYNQIIFINKDVLNSSNLKIMKYSELIK